VELGLVFCHQRCHLAQGTYFQLWCCFSVYAWLMYAVAAGVLLIAVRCCCHPTAVLQGPHGCAERG
jgi:hypothetical protein